LIEQFTYFKIKLKKKETLPFGGVFCAYLFVKIIMIEPNVIDDENDYGWYPDQTF
tara:strand:+ start:841 stop:1005 length:165 start_codon:yes stop_codon:yes gene_type:complete